MCTRQTVVPVNVLESKLDVPSTHLRVFICPAVDRRRCARAANSSARAAWNASSFPAKSCVADSFATSSRRSIAPTCLPHVRRALPSHPSALPLLDPAPAHPARRRCASWPLPSPHPAPGACTWPACPPTRAAARTTRPRPSPPILPIRCGTSDVRRRGARRPATYWRARPLSARE